MTRAELEAARAIDPHGWMVAPLVLAFVFGLAMASVMMGG
jgi:hypothetical protein